MEVAAADLLPLPCARGGLVPFISVSVHGGRKRSPHRRPRAGSSAPPAGSAPLLHSAASRPRLLGGVGPVPRWRRSGGRRKIDAPPELPGPLPPARMPLRREAMQFCISSLLQRQFASRVASAVGGSTARAQWPARGKIRAVEVSLRPCLVPKNFQDSPSHRIFGHMHGTLNVVLKK